MIERELSQKKRVAGEGWGSSARPGAGRDEIGWKRLGGLSADPRPRIGETESAKGESSVVLRKIAGIRQLATVTFALPLHDRRRVPCATTKAEPGAEVDMGAWLLVALGLLAADEYELGK